MAPWAALSSPRPKVLRNERLSMTASGAAEGGIVAMTRSGCDLRQRHLSPALRAQLDLLRISERIEQQLVFDHGPPPIRPRHIPPTQFAPGRVARVQWWSSMIRMMSGIGIPRSHSRIGMFSLLRFAYGVNSSVQFASRCHRAALLPPSRPAPPTRLQ